MYTAVAVCLYNCQEPIVQLQYCIQTGKRRPKSQLMTTGGAYASIRIYLLWFVSLIRVSVRVWVGLPNK